LQFTERLGRAEITVDRGRGFHRGDLRGGFNLTDKVPGTPELFRQLDLRQSAFVAEFA
jgi:hypothetical protein